MFKELEIVDILDSIKKATENGGKLKIDVPAFPAAQFWSAVGIVLVAIGALIMQQALILQEQKQQGATLKVIAQIARQNENDIDKLQAWRAYEAGKAGRVFPYAKVEDEE